MFFFAARSPRSLDTFPHDRKLAEFYNANPNIWALPKIFGDQKHAKFWSILYNLRFWSRIYPERLKISKIGKLYDLDSRVIRLIPPAFHEKGPVNFVPQITENYILTKLFQATYREAKVIKWAYLLEVPPPTIWEGKKLSKIRRDFWQRSTLIEISPKRIDISEIEKVFDQLQPFPRWGKIR